MVLHLKTPKRFTFNIGILQRSIEVHFREGYAIKADEIEKLSTKEFNLRVLDKYPSVNRQYFNPEVKLYLNDKGVPVYKITSEHFYTHLFCIGIMHDSAEELLISKSIIYEGIRYTIIDGGLLRAEKLTNLN